MPVIELHKTGSGYAEATQAALQTYVQLSALQMQRDKNELANKIATKQLEWATEDRARQERERRADAEFAARKVGGVSSPADIEAERDASIGAQMPSAEGGFVAGAEGSGSAPGSMGFLTGGLVGAQRAVEVETDAALKKSEQDMAKLTDLVRDLSPGARALAEQHFAQENARNVGGAAQRDVSRALRAALRRQVMPGEEEWLGSLVHAVDAWDAETGEGLSPWDAEAQFRERYKEWHEDQTDREWRQTQVQSMSAMVQAMGLGTNRVVMGAVAAVASQGLTPGQGFRAIQTEWNRVNGEKDDVEEKKSTVDLSAFGGKRSSIEDLFGLREGGDMASMTTDQAETLDLWARQIASEDPEVRRNSKGEVNWENPESKAVFERTRSRIARGLGWTGRPGAAKKPEIEPTGVVDFDLHLQRGGPGWAGADKRVLTTLVTQFLATRDVDGLVAAFGQMGIPRSDVPAEFWDEMAVRLGQ